MGKVEDQLSVEEPIVDPVLVKCHWTKPLMSYGEVDREHKGQFPLVRCATMNSKLELTNSHRKGLMMLIVMHTGDACLGDAVVGIAYKTGTNDPGTMLNFCPWCGGNIIPRPRDEEQLVGK